MKKTSKSSTTKPSTKPESVFSIKIKGEDCVFAMTKLEGTVEEKIVLLAKQQVSGEDFSKLSVYKQIMTVNLYEDWYKKYENLQPE